MKKIFSFFAAMLVALAVTAGEVNITAETSNSLKNAVAAATAGDVIILADGTYNEPEQVKLDKSLTIKAAEGAKPVLALHYYCSLTNGAQVTFQGIKFDGAAYNDGAGASDHCIRPYDNTAEKSLTMIDCEFCNWTKGYILYPQRADRCVQSITIQDCYFHDNARSAVYIETGSSAPCPLAELYVENSTFVGTSASYKAIDLKNGGEAVADAKMRIDHCTFYNYGPVRSEKSTDVIISNSIFAFPTAGATATTLYAGAAINNCLAFNMTHAEGPTVTNPIEGDPLFADAANGDLTLAATSPAVGAGADGKTLGDPRWFPAAAAEPTYTVAGTQSLMGVNWDPTATQNDMIKQEDGTYKLVKENVTLYNGDYEYKVAIDHKWENGEATNNSILNVGPHYLAIYNVTFTYNPADGATGATAELVEATPPGIDIAGEWDKNLDGSYITHVAVESEDKFTCSYEVELTAGSYKFYMYNNGTANSKAACTVTRDANVVEGITAYYLVKEDMTLVADIEGKYTFTWIYAEKKLIVTYPAKPEPDLTLYLRLSSDWAGWPARYAIYTWKEGVGDKWVAMTAVDGENNIYTAAIPKDNDKLIFVRLNGETTGLSWDDKWSQTVDLDFPEGENNLFTVTAGGTGSECTGVWSVYGAPYVPQHADGYYLVGKFGGVETWGVAEERAMTRNTEAGHEEYMITVTLAEGDEFKVVKSDNDNLTWYPNEVGNYVVDAKHAGEKTIYFRPDGLGDDAFYAGVIYVPATPATPVAKDFEIDLRDGQLGENCAKYLYIDAEQNYNYYDEAPAEYNAYFAAKSFNGNTHGYDQLIVTVPVEAASYKVTLGKCTYAYSADYTMATVKTEDGATTLGSCQQNTVSGEGVCYHQDPANNVASMTFTSEAAQMVKIICAHYTPYIKFEKIAGGTAIDNANVETKAIKVIENGQLFIIKNGIRYTATGAVVK